MNVTRDDIPKKIGRYEIVDAIGFGAMGAVYKAFDPLIKRIVAIKTLRLDIPPQSPQYKSFIDRFYHEARISGTLSHPNIITLFDIGQTDDQVPFLAMEFVEGETVNEFLERGERFKPEQVIGLVSQIASALDYAHAKGVIHRDVKPSNLIIHAGEKVKVTDFGIAKLMDSEMTQGGTLLGTPSYMSPEQAMGELLDGRSDIFSLGVVAFEMLSGQQPFPGNNITSILYKLVHAEPIRPGNLEILGLLPEKWHQVFSTVLAKSPAERYGTAAHFVESLEMCLGSWFGSLSGETVVMATPPPVAPPPGQEATLVPHSRPVAMPTGRSQPESKPGKTTKHPVFPSLMEEKTVVSADSPEPTGSGGGAPRHEPPVGNVAPTRAAPSPPPPSPPMARVSEPTADAPTVIAPSPTKLEPPPSPAAKQKPAVTEVAPSPMRVEPPPPPSDDATVVMETLPKTALMSAPVILEPVPDTGVVIVEVPRTRLPVVWIVTAALGVVLAFAAVVGLWSLQRRASAPAPPAVEATPVPAPSTLPPGGRPAPPSEARGQIGVVTEPEGASVSLNGEPRGVTPLTMSDLALGAYTVRIEKEGFEAVTRDIEVTREAPEEGVSLALKKAPPRPARATLNVDSKPPGASVLIDGKPSGKTPLSAFAVGAGKRRIRVQKDGFKSWALTVDLRSGQTMPIIATLEPMDASEPSVAPPRSSTPVVDVKEGELVQKGPDVVNPRCIRCDPVGYPEVAKKLKLQGLVEVSFVVTENGTVEDIRVQASAGEVLDQAVVDVVKNWKYQPATKRGVRVKVRETSRHRFRLGN